MLASQCDRRPIIRLIHELDGRFAFGSTTTNRFFRFRSLRGKTLEFTYGQTPVVDGAALDYQHWPLFGGPFLEAAVDSERLIIQYKDRRRTLDFRSLTVTDSGN